MISSALLPSLLSPFLAATALVSAAQDPEFARHNVAASAAFRKLLARVSTWRRFNEGLKQCGFIPFTTHNITTQADGATSVATADLDGDADLDVLSASWWDDKIAWYENFDGAGEFSGPQRVITTQARGAISVTAADLDGDADLDVLSASWEDNMIAWYENLDGVGNMSASQRVITTQVDGASAVAAADLDGDADLDVLSASFEDKKIAWYENVDGAGDFSGPQRVITTHADGAWSVAAADLDGDADLDILSASLEDDKIAWYENLNGTGVFSTQHVITTRADGARSVAAADIDGDADIDVLSASQNDDKIAWYENLDGAGSFLGPQRVITTQANFASSVAAADLDGDGDFDVLSASYYDDKIAWYENLDGAGNFSQLQRIITTQAKLAHTVVVADLDGDGDLDILSASEDDDKIAWYENSCEPMTPAPSPPPTPMPTFWGPQLFGRHPQTAAFGHLCMAWCVVFSAINIIVLGYIVHTTQHKDKMLARTILTIVLSHYDYFSDTLFIGFQNFVTPTLFVAALITYLLPLAVFIVIYRHVVRAHLAHILTLTMAKIVVRFDSWDELPKALTEIASFALFLLAFAASTFVYLMLLFVFISCKLMSVSFFAVKFLETGGFRCTQEAFEVMFKRSIFSELIFESSGELIIALADNRLRTQQGLGSNARLSPWARLSIVGSCLMLSMEVWPYLYQIVWMGRGLNAGIAAVSTNLEFTLDELLGTCFIDRLFRLPGFFAPSGRAVYEKPAEDKFPCMAEVDDAQIVDSAELDSAEQCEH